LDNSNISSYSYKLKLNDAGDFFLPISSSTNFIKSGKYKVVFYAIDNEGSKAQGEYFADITDVCSNNILSSIRTGGFSALALVILGFILLVSIYRYNHFKSKRKNFRYDVNRKV
jgi:hypothetical protein